MSASHALRPCRLAPLACALALASCAAAADDAARAPVAFTGPKADDTLTVTLLDPESDDGAAVFVVRDARGAPVYADAVALSALSWDDPAGRWTVAEARARLGFTPARTSDYAADLVARADAGVGAFWPVDDGDALDRARAADAPLLCYVNAPGGYTCAWFDPESRRGAPLIEGAS